MVPVGVRGARRPAADAQRQGRPRRPPRPRPRRAVAPRAPTSSRPAGRSRRPWPRPGPSCSAATRRRPRQLLRAGRPLADGPPAPRADPQALRRRGPAQGLHRGAHASRTWPAWSSGPWPTADGPPAPPIERADRSGPLPASFAQQRLWFLDQLAPGSADLQLSRRGPARRPARRRRAPPRTRRGRPPSRGPAHDLRRRRRRSLARSSPTRSTCPCPSRTSPGSPTAQRLRHAPGARPRGGPASLRSGPGPADPRRADPPRRATSTSSR